jgi:hypothetical protein
MDFDWQNVTVGLIVAAALAYLARSGWQAVRRRRAGCGACSTCPAAKADEPAVVTLAPLNREIGR